MLIDGKFLGANRCYVIAEAGHNHSGDLKTALKMIQIAAVAGADAIKFQKRDNPNLYTKRFYDSPYNSENAFGPTYGSHRQALEFSRTDFKDIQDFAQACRITVFATAFDEASVDFCFEMGFPAIKVASADLTNHPLLRHVASTRLPVLLSTGGATLEDVKDAVGILQHSPLALLQCTAIYPAPAEKLDLKVIQTYQQAFPGLIVGASLHDNGIAMAIAAYTLGARVIEQHFTLNRAAKGTDHAFSLEPQGLGKLVRDLRRTELAMGDGQKKVYEDELESLRKMSKSIYASHPLTQGQVITEDDVVCRSPGIGLPPSMYPAVVGRTLTRDLDEEEPIGLKDLAPATFDSSI